VDAVGLGVKALSEVEERGLDTENLEAAVLDRTRSRRKFRRMTDQEIRDILGQE
jgi:hypothetical protein